MKRLVSIAAMLGVAASLIGATAAQAGGGHNGGKQYTCSNQGGGLNHTVNCVGGTLNGNTVTITIGDVNILSGDQLTVLQDSLNNVNVGNVTTQTAIADIDLDVVGVYNSVFYIPLSVTQVNTCIA